MLKRGISPLIQPLCRFNSGVNKFKDINRTRQKMWKTVDNV